MRLVDSTNLADHLRYLVGILCPGGAAEPTKALCDLMQRYGVESNVSCFWYGIAGAQPPAIPAFAKEVFDRLGAMIETDFDTD
jgi:hypothetical protein